MNNNFDDFWNQKIEFVKNISPKCNLRKISFSTFDNISYYDLYFKSFDDAKIHAKYIKNEKFRTDNPNKKIPVLFYFHGYPASSRNWLEKSAFCSLGYDVVALDFRGQGGLSEDNSKTTFSSFGHLLKGINEGVEEMIFVKNIIDTLLLFKIISDFGDVDKHNFVTYGASQGGAFSIIAASLNKNVRKCIALYPFLANFGEIYDKDNSKNAYNELNLYSRWFNVDGKNDKKLLEMLSYIDVINFAPKVKADVLFGISKLDKDCPVESQYAIYNKINSKKELHIYKKYKHEDIPHFNNEVLKFLLENN